MAKELRQKQVSDDSKPQLLKWDNNTTSENGSLNVIRVKSTVNTLELVTIDHSKIPPAFCDAAVVKYFTGHAMKLNFSSALPSRGLSLV